MGNYVFTSESVTEGHPDKICDAVSDAVLDAILAKDASARVAAETMVKTGFAIVAGEVTTTAWIDLPTVVRDTIRDIGYTDSSMGFDADTCAVMNAIESQSPDIAQGVSEGEGLYKELGAGDQGLMFGYACNDTRALMPAPIYYAHRMSKRLAKVRKDGTLPWLRPDGKTQVTIEYVDGKPSRVESVVLSTQHSEDISRKALIAAIREEVIENVIPAKMLDRKTRYWINPTGRFVVGGPYGDAGLTGRKIIVDTYGGMGRHGGGAFSGKDPTKVDRSACYFARYVAKNIVAAKLAERCEVQVAYAIGVAKPMGVYVTTFGTGVVEDEKIARAVERMFDFRPASIIETLNLLRPIYRNTAAYGHFGRTEKSFTWEKTDRAEELASLLSPSRRRPSSIPPSAERVTSGDAPKNGKANGSKANGSKANGSKTSSRRANGRTARASL